LLGLYEKKRVQILLVFPHHFKKIGLLPNLKKGLASCETKKGSSPGHTGKTFSSEPFKAPYKSCKTF
jgi:hypothetical protein